MHMYSKNHYFNGMFYIHTYSEYIHTQKMHLNIKAIQFIVRLVSKLTKMLRVNISVDEF